MSSHDHSSWGRVLVFATVLCGLLSLGAAADDGEGTARLVAPARIVAGAKMSVEVEVTVGSSGIAVGGGLTLGLHHAAGWGGVQVAEAAKPGYIAVTSDPPAEFEVEWHHWIPNEMLTDKAPSGRSDAIFHQVCAARVKGAPLEPGQRVTFTIGANAHGVRAPRSTDHNHEFHIMTDVDGDGVYKGIAESPTRDIVSGPAHHLAAVAPATVVVGEPLDLLIRAEDENFNVAADYCGAVTVRDEEGRVLVREESIKGGLGTVSILIKAPGPQRFRLSDGVIEGRSNPCRVFAFPPRQRIYWGDIHGHTSVSDGLGDDAREFFAFGRDVARLDVCALTDHGHFDWPANVAAVKEFHEPGRYVTILAQESGAKSDHMNFYFRTDGMPHIEGWPTAYDQLYDMLAAQYDTANATVITGPHHFTYDRGDDRYPFGLWDDRTARFVEVYSSHGTSEYLGNPRPCPGARDESKFMQAGLAAGLRFGVIGSSDNHDSHPGRTVWGHYPGGLVAFMAEELTREAIWDALWNRRVYATSFDRIYLEFTINGQPMGSDLVTSDPLRIDYYVIGRTDDLKVTLLRNNEPCAVEETAKGVVEASREDPPPTEPAFYYLRVEQDNGERAWSTPIWVTPVRP